MNDLIYRLSRVEFDDCDKAEPYLADDKTSQFYEFPYLAFSDYIATIAQFRTPKNNQLAYVR